MATSFYWLGVSLAISSGVSNHIGTIFQKKVINELPDESKFMRSLVKEKTNIMPIPRTKPSITSLLK